jgi:hypothetical protein
MITVEAFVGARGTDSVTLIDAVTAAKFKASGVDFVFQYLGTVTAQGVADIVAAGLGFMVVTYADQFDGPKAVAELRALDLPAGCTVWLDVESIGPTVTIASLKAQINSWAAAVFAAGYVPGLYVGANCQLTSLELYQLAVVRYWASESMIVDRNGQLAAPACGFCVVQCFPSVLWQGVEVDMDFIHEDYQNRLPSWVAAA